MVDKEANETTTRIDGHIFGPYEVILEDDKQNQIDKSMIYIHSSRSELGDNDDPLFVSIEISAACIAGGFFNTVVTRDTGKLMFRKSSGIDEDWYRVATHLFPIDESVLEANDVADEELENKYQLSAKLQVHYNEEDEVVNDKLTVTIKTKAKIPVTVGSIELEPLEIKDEEVENEEHQEDLFDWLELTTFQNQAMVAQIKQLNLTIDNLKLENFKLNNYYQQSKSDYESIITDLETKFYHVLNSKKDYIWELIQEKNTTTSGNDIHGGRIVGLNERFMKKQGKLQVIDQSKIGNNLDEKYIRKRKEPVKKMVANKRRKVIKSEDDEEEGVGDITDEDEEYKVKQEDSIEVKKENDSFRFNPSLEIKDDDSVNSDKFRFTRSLRSDRQVVDDELESDKEKNGDDVDDDDDENNNQEDGDNEILSHTEEEEEEEEEEDPYEEEKDQESLEEDEKKHISKNNSKVSQYLSDNEVETQAATTFSSNDVIDDSLPDRQQHENEKNQEQETDYSESDVEKEIQDDNSQPKAPSKSQSQVETDYEDSDND